MLREIGQKVANLGTATVANVRFTGDLTAALYGVIRRPSTGNWKSLVPLVEGAGADALPIVALLNFLVGFVMAFQSSRQLELYGANVFVADVVGISMTRELAPTDHRHHRVWAFGRGLRRRARHDAGVGGDRRAARDGLRPRARYLIFRAW